VLGTVGTTVATLEDVFTGEVLGRASTDASLTVRGEVDPADGLLYVGEEGAVRAVVLGDPERPPSRITIGTGTEQYGDATGEGIFASVLLPDRGSAVRAVAPGREPVELLRDATAWIGNVVVSPDGTRVGLLRRRWDATRALSFQLPPEVAARLRASAGRPGTPSR
jgi:hypothetical protein